MYELLSRLIFRQKPKLIKRKIVLIYMNKILQYHCKRRKPMRFCFDGATNDEFNKFGVLFFSSYYIAATAGGDRFGYTTVEIFLKNENKFVAYSE